MRCLFFYLYSKSFAELDNMSKHESHYRIVLLAFYLLLSVYAAWRLFNLVGNIRADGMIPQLWSPLLSITAEVCVLIACAVLLALRSQYAKWVGLAYFGLWLTLILFSLPTHLPHALDFRPVHIGQFSQSALSRDLLVFELAMLLVALLLALGVIRCGFKTNDQ
jgi:hypothetical protein